MNAPWRGELGETVRLAAPIVFTQLAWVGMMTTDTAMIGRLGAERDVNVANASVARQQLTDTTRRARLEAAQAQRAVTVAESNFGVSRQARDIAVESARLARIAFMHGTGTSFDLVDSARRQRLAEIDVTIKEFEVVRARIAALLALSNCSL